MRSRSRLSEHPYFRSAEDIWRLNQTFSLRGQSLHDAPEFVWDGGLWTQVGANTVGRIIHFGICGDWGLGCLLNEQRRQSPVFVYIEVVSHELRRCRLGDFAGLDNSPTNYFVQRGSRYRWPKVYIYVTMEATHQWKWGEARRLISRAITPVNRAGDWHREMYKDWTIGIGW